ncbi:hypothetical protein [Nocardia sp. NPDC059239]|uniref:hypothetical protein n=1 Tax=unclassified Nocardia TaxID=2637762 RepID=UPI0036A34ADB
MAEVRFDAPAPDNLPITKQAIENVRAAGLKNGGGIGGFKTLSATFNELLGAIAALEGEVISLRESRGSN